MALRIRGRSIDAARTVTVSQWERQLNQMLQAAMEYGRLDTKRKAQRDWLSRNAEHPLWMDRKRQERRTWQRWQDAARDVQDAAEALSRLQAGLPADSRSGLEALLGHELWPAVPNVWAMTAARMQTDDIFAVAARVMMDLRAEDEGDATDADTGESHDASLAFR